MLQNPVPVATMQPQAPSVPLSQEQPAAIAYNPETAGLWMRDLEQKIIAGYKPTRDEQKQLVAMIRQGRAEAAAAAPKGKGKTKKQLSAEQLDKDLDDALGL